MDKGEAGRGGTGEKGWKDGDTKGREGGREGKSIVLLILAGCVRHLAQTDRDSVAYNTYISNEIRCNTTGHNYSMINKLVWFVVVFQAVIHVPGCYVTTMGEEC